MIIFYNNANSTCVLASATAMRHLSRVFIVIRRRPYQKGLFRVLSILTHVRKLDTVHRGICNWQSISPSIIDLL